MEKIAETTPAAGGKSRSSSASIKLGYRLFATSFAGVVKTVWPAALLFALVCGLLGCVGVATLPRIAAMVLSGDASFQTALGGQILPLAFIAACIVVGGLAEVAAYGGALSLLATATADGRLMLPHKWLSFSKHYFWRTLKAVLVCLAFVLVASLLVGGVGALLLQVGYAAKSPLVTLALLALLSLALCLVLLPLAYVAMRYVVTGGLRLWPSLAAGFKVGFRHYGYVFAVCLFCAVIGVIASYVLAQPAVILGVASTQAQLGAAMGDPLGMPSYITALSFVVFVLAGLVLVSVRLSMLFPLYYMVVSIDSAEEERKQYSEKLKN